jgi:hypothetical protein
MLKTGKYRALRNIPIGWVLQAIHSTDESERFFRVLLELLFFFLSYFIIFLTSGLPPGLAIVVFLMITIHTFMFIVNGNFLVYLLDSFTWVKNPGIQNLLLYIKKCEKYFTIFNCCDAILIYGSMCRSQLHIRSDLDLRIVRRLDSKLGLLSLPIGFLMRFYSLFVLVPVDLEVVDSFDFLTGQMRDDEKPIVVYLREGIFMKNSGLNISDVIKNPKVVLK